MRIDKVHIVQHKNLIDFDIDLNQSKMETVLLGQNATGKSNFIEALILIFKHLDLNTKPPFNYTIRYDIKNFSIQAKYDGKKYSFIKYAPLADTPREKKAKLESVVPLTNKDFFDKKNDFLPKYVFAYYSGVSNRLRGHFDDHQKIFYDKSIKEGVTKEEVEELRRLFYVQLVHSYFVLLAYFSFNDEEESSAKFLNDVLGIEELDSILFVLNEPAWKGKGDDRFWGASGLVEEFLNKLWECSLAPIYDNKNVQIDFRRTSKQELLYLYVQDKAKLRELASFYRSNTDFFKALESTYISDLIHEVRVKVKKKNVNELITFRELSEGEQQLLTVLGLLKFTKDDESLILLDEPDTHLNPVWKWKYRHYLKDVVQKKSSTQIIINTHDPLVIGSLVKEEVRIFRWSAEKKKIVAEEPDVDPKGLGVSGILKSELFGLKTILDEETQALLDERNKLLFKESEHKLSKEEEGRLRDLFEILNALGFTKTFKDPLYSEFIVKREKELNSEKKQLSKTKAKASKALEIIKKSSGRKKKG
jgi:predicted ATPase